MADGPASSCEPARAKIRHDPLEDARSAAPLPQGRRCDAGHPDGLLQSDLSLWRAKFLKDAKSAGADASSWSIYRPSTMTSCASRRGAPGSISCASPRRPPTTDACPPSCATAVGYLLLAVAGITAQPPQRVARSSRRWRGLKRHTALPIASASASYAGASGAVGARSRCGGGRLGLVERLASRLDKKGNARPGLAAAY